MRKVLVITALSFLVVGVLAVGASFGRGVLAEFTSWGSPDAQVPGLIPFQGVLTYSSSNGVHVEDGDYNVSFALYKAATGGTAVWTETQSVTTVSGVFNTHLGTNTAITPSMVASDELWLGMTFTDWPHGEMTPRQRIGSTVYALVAQEVANPKNPDFYLSQTRSSHCLRSGQAQTMLM